MAAVSVFRHLDDASQTVCWLGVESRPAKNGTSVVAFAVRGVDSGVGDRSVLHSVSLPGFACVLGRCGDRIYPACFSDAGTVFGAVMAGMLQALQTIKEIKAIKDVGVCVLYSDCNAKDIVWGNCVIIRRRRQTAP